jgi:hypothetical protein
MVRGALRGAFQIRKSAIEAGLQFRNGFAAGAGERLQPGSGRGKIVVGNGQFLVCQNFGVGGGAFGARPKQVQLRLLLLKPGFD